MGGGFAGGSEGKNPPANAGGVVQSLGQEDPLEEGRATHSRILAGESHGQRSPAGYNAWGQSWTRRSS